MAFSFFSKLVVATSICRSCLAATTPAPLGILQTPPETLSTTAQFVGNVSYDGISNITFTIYNNSTLNITVPGTNNIFDRQNSVLANTSFQITTSDGKKVRLNGTNYPAPPLSDAVFQDLPSEGIYTRSLNLSNYILNNTGEGTAYPPDITNVTLNLTLPSFVYGLDTTGFKGGETIATYYLSKGLKKVPIISEPYQFNYTVPKEFTNDQAKAIADDARQLRLETASESSGTVNVDKRRARRRM